MIVNRKNRFIHHIAHPISAITLLILSGLCVSIVLVGWRIVGRTPDIPVLPPTPTSLPIGLTSVPVPPGMEVIFLNGIVNEKYKVVVSNSTFFDATNWTSTAYGPGPDGPTRKAVDIYTGESSTDGTKILWHGGMITGSIPESWNWRKAHDFGGGGIFIQNDGSTMWQYLRIHNVQDGIIPSEATEYSNTGSWMLRDCYFTAIRDDAVENDRFVPGTIQDCLFDGVFVFLSEQDENVDGRTPIGPDEENTLYVKGAYVRLYGTNGTDGPGKWFKWQGDVPHHNVAVSDSVFAVGSEPRLGWSEKTIPPEVNWVGENNFILWLGTPGEYGGPKPAGVTFLEGEAAQDKWISVRNKWLTDHGLPPQDLPADYNPHDAPVVQIPVSP